MWDKREGEKKVREKGEKVRENISINDCTLFFMDDKKW